MNDIVVTIISTGGALLTGIVSALIVAAKSRTVLENEVQHIKEEINRLEHKQDKHNGLIERMVVVEESTKSAHHRITEHERKN